MATAALRLLLRRRPTAPQALFPTSMPRYGKPRCPLDAVAAAAGFPPAVRPVQCWPPAVPSLLCRYYRSKVCAPPPPPRPRTNRQETMRPKKGEQGYYIAAYTEDIVEWFVDGMEYDYKEWNDRMIEALEAYGNGLKLFHQGSHKKAFDMFQKGLDGTLEAVILSEKWLDHFAKTIGNSRCLSPEQLQQNQMFCKEVEDLQKSIRQNLKEMSRGFKTLKKLKWLHTCISTAGQGVLLLLMLMIMGISSCFGHGRGEGIFLVQISRRAGLEPETGGSSTGSTTAELLAQMLQLGSLNGLRVLCG